MNSNDPPSAPPTAPPTVRGDISGAVRPTSRPAVASLVCGLIGFIVPGVNVAAIVLGIVGLRRIARSVDPKQLGHAYAIIGICIGGAGVLMNGLIAIMALSTYWSFSQLSVWKAGENLAVVHTRMVQQAAATGAYPVHVAELVTQSGSSPVYLLVTDEESVTESGRVTVGEYDFYDYTFTTDDDRAVLAAIEALDTSADWYRFGDRWFVRLGTNTGHADIVFAWDEAWANGLRTIVFDDGHWSQVQVDEWTRTWEADAAARKTLGLEGIEVPPVGGDQDAEAQPQ